LQNGATCLLAALLGLGTLDRDALSEQRLKILRALIEAGADVHASITLSGEYARSLAMVAARWGHLAALSLLVDAGATLNAKVRQRFPALL